MVYFITRPSVPIRNGEKISECRVENLSTLHFSSFSMTENPKVSKRANSEDEANVLKSVAQTLSYSIRKR